MSNENKTKIILNLCFCQFACLWNVWDHEVHKQFKSSSLKIRTNLNIYTHPTTTHFTWISWSTITLYTHFLYIFLWTAQILNTHKHTHTQTHTRPYIHSSQVHQFYKPITFTVYHLFLHFNRNTRTHLRSHHIKPSNICNAYSSTLL
jgi:hypothetical protein